MTALRRISTADVSSPVADEPVALLQPGLPGPVEAAPTVYRQVRRGRRVVEVACGTAEASALLVEAWKRSA